MENKQLGKWLIIIGIIIAIVPMIVISGFAFYSTSSLGVLGSYGPYIFFIIGIIIAIYGEILRKK
jgi:hypothetical protein